MFTFLALAHMVDATACFWFGMGWGGDVHVPCICTHARCSRSLHLHTWSMLHHIFLLVGIVTYFALAHMLCARDIMGLDWGGVGMLPFLVLAHMLDATQHVGWGVEFRGDAVGGSHGVGRYMVYIHGYACHV